MIKHNIKSIEVVVYNKICCGCGACSVICPSSCIRFVYGLRYNFPTVDSSKCVDCGRCLKVCPSAFLLNGTDPGFVDIPIKESRDCFLIHSPRDQIRADASSGGFITGLILQLMDSNQIDGAVVTRCEGENPLVAESFIAMDRQSILASCGSKYSPVSNCTVLREIKDRLGRYVFVGTPCMIEGLAKLQEFLPELKKCIKLSIGLVCSGMSSRLMTKSYIAKDGGVDLNAVRRICYRGNGWPGRFRVYGEDNCILMDRPYIDGLLPNVVGCDHYLRCENCLDHWAYYADIVVSDPWSKEMIKSETQGRSAIMVRTERGKRAVSAAINSGDFIADRISATDMIAYNRHLAIDSKHLRHSWMALYQLFFFGRVRYLLPVLRYSMARKLAGLKTTLKARMNKKYYY